jgi:hypothetical protein
MEPAERARVETVASSAHTPYGWARLAKCSVRRSRMEGQARDPPARGRRCTSRSISNPSLPAASSALADYA